MRYLLAILVFYMANLFGEYSIVFIHIGNDIPLYADVALSQARLFNPNARIILLGSDNGLQRFSPFSGIELCSYENLPKSLTHKKYEERCIETSPFWRYTSERFLYLWDLIDAYGLKNVFHLENDNMLYADLEPLLPLFQKYYPGVAATFDNEDRCIPGFVWVSNRAAMKSLANFFTKKAKEPLSDMYVIGNYRKTHPSTIIGNLPIIMPSYASVYPLESPSLHQTRNPEAYSNNADRFNAIFDGAAIGQFLGGNDPIHEYNKVGFINESCLFNPSLLQYQWIPDEQGRLVPYAIFLNHPYKIINLHVHSKRLGAFKS